MATTGIVPNTTKTAFTLKDLRDLIHLKLNQKGLRYAVYAMIISYFYNMGVIKYSITGENELRLFDVAGFVIMYYYFKNYGIIHRYIRTDKVFYSLFVFIQFGTFSMIFTIISAISIAKYSWTIQSLLYLFHFWAFFLTAVFVAVLMRNQRFLKRFVYTILVSAILCFLVIVLQNLEIIPYLWSSANHFAYKGFLNGTLGPNKIVSGMTSFITFIFCVGIINEKRFEVNKLIGYSAMALSLVVLALSGSRTAYLAIIIFLVYYFIRSTKSFFKNAIVVFLGLFCIALLEPLVIDKIVDMYNYRITNKIREPSDLSEGNVTNLYEDLGSGRHKLLGSYTELLMEEFYYLPLGRGMNNRLDTFSSAHNMYLSLIYELGIVGLVLYMRWLILYLFVKLHHFKNLAIALHGLVLSMLITLFFGEHLYIYRPLFAIVGLFILVCTLLSAPHYLIEKNET